MTTHNASNERIKRQYFAYLKEAKRQSEATIDAVAESLARFEANTRHRDFKTFRVELAVAFKTSQPSASRHRPPRLCPISP
ncbi:MAG: hypothetical protein ACRD26_05685 [Vicinamibacterales bacterium]